jgi:hypothetical protein
VLASFLSITIVDCAFISILAIDWSVDNSFDCIASSDGASVWVLDRYRSVNTVSIGDITSFGCACIAISAAFLGMNTVSINARINSAKIFVITIHRSVNASRMRIARVLGAWIVVVTSDCNVLASSSRIARIGCASIGVITADWSDLALSIDAFFCSAWVFVIAIENVLAFSIHTKILGASVFVITVNWGAYTSFAVYANIDTARILIVTKSIIWSVHTS